MKTQHFSKCFNDTWSVLALMRFSLACIVCVNHLSDFTALGIWSFIPIFGAFEAIMGFLLISGYSIASSYEKNQKGFIKRRALRIYPVYLTCLIIACLVNFHLENKWPNLADVLINATFLNQIVSPESIISPAWSLSLEFWLYCLTPILFAVSDKNLARLIVCSFIFYCIYTCGRTLFHWNYYAGTGYGLNLPVLAFAWLAGFRLAKHKDAPAASLKMITAIFAFHIFLTSSIAFASKFKKNNLSVFFEIDILSFTMQSITLAVVLYFFSRVLQPNLDRRPSHLMKWLGDISFPLYLVHYPLFSLLHSMHLKSPSVYLLLSMASAAIIYQAIDFYSRQRSTQTLTLPEKFAS